LEFKLEESKSNKEKSVDGGSGKKKRSRKEK